MQLTGNCITIYDTPSQLAAALTALEVKKLEQAGNSPPQHPSAVGQLVSAGSMLICLLFTSDNPIQAFSVMMV